MKDRSHTIPVRFPVRGLVEHNAYEDQPEGTTVDAMNVWTFGRAEDRARGSQRRGVKKAMPGQVDTGGALVQGLESSVVVQPQPSVVINANAIVDRPRYTGQPTGYTGPICSFDFDEENYGFAFDLGDLDYAAGDYPSRASTFPVRHWHEHKKDAANPDDRWFGVLIDPLGSSQEIQVEDISDNLVLDATGLDVAALDANSFVSVDDSFAFTEHPDLKRRVYRLRIKTTDGAAGTDEYICGIFMLKGGILGTDPISYYRAVIIKDAGVNTSTLAIQRVIEPLNGASASTITTPWETSTFPGDEDWHQLEVRMDWDQESNAITLQVLWDGVLQESGASVKTYEIASADVPIWSTTTSVTLPPDTQDNGFWYEAGFGNSRNSGANNVAYPRMDDYEAFWASKPSQVDYDVQLLGVSNGSLRYAPTVPSSWKETPDSSGDNIVESGSRPVEMLDAFQKVYIIDGDNYKVYDPATLTVADWDATAGAPVQELPGGNGDDGSKGGGSPDGNPRARIIALYRARIVMAGLADDPHNWFMSAVNLPRNWDYADSGSLGENSAVSGNTAVAGKLGDVITALIPYFDDILMVCGAGSIWTLSGDIATGSFKALTRQIGVTGSRAWTWGTSRELYFFYDGLYRMAPNAFDITDNNRISAGRLDDVFRNIDPTTHQVQLEWDITLDGCHIFITPTIDGEQTHYFWDRRANSFWPYQFGDGVGPTAATRFTDGTTKSQLLLGGFDSYVRSFDPAYDYDEGTTADEAIESHVLMGPVLDPRSDQELRLLQTRVVMSQDTEAASLSLLEGDSAEAAAKSSPTVTVPLVAGRNGAINEKARGSSMYFRISNNVIRKGWEFEKMMAVVEPAGDAQPR